ncbi:MAG: alpha/beta fold hydrolase, partial [Alphaproteobacteria bacterium]|nr:alpha/beta fold hydrolase [Alphaproteobacteria bacterium]
MHNSSNNPPGAQAEVPLPRPLLLHLTSLNFWCHSSSPASQLWRRDSLPWSPDLTARAAELSREFSALANQLGRGPAEGLFAQQLRLAAEQKLADFAAGVSAYQNQRKSLPPRRTGRLLAEFGAARLLDYGEAGGAGGVAENAPVVLVVPSLVNRATILDLAPERSLVEYLARSGLRPVVLDWGSPSAAENGFSLTDYICSYLAAGLQLAVGQNGGRPVMVLGYCMGGLLALAVAQLYSQRVSALVLLATPWDFHSDSRLIGRLRANLPAVERLIDQQNGLSVDSLQSLFYGLD